MRKDSPTGALLGTAAVPSTGSMNRWTDVTIPAPTDKTSMGLFLVFKGTANFRLNFFEVNGKGLSPDTRPTVKITAPTENAAVQPGEVTFTADATDAENAITKVEFFVDGAKVGEDDSARDSDGDGSRDAEEIANMTGLNDGESRLKILSFAPVEGAVEPETYRVTFTCFPGLGYAVEAHPEIDFTAPEVRVIPFGVAAGYTGSVDAALMPGRDFLRVRRD